MKLKPILKRKNSKYNQDVIELRGEGTSIKFWCNNCSRYLYIDLENPKEVSIKKFDYLSYGDIHIKAKAVCKVCGAKAKFNTFRDTDKRISERFPIPGRRIPKK